MGIEQWKQEHQIVFRAFERHLPNDHLSSIYSDLDVGRQRQLEETYGRVMAAVGGELGDRAAELLVEYFLHPPMHAAPEHHPDRTYMIHRLASAMASLYCERHPSVSFVSGLIDCLSRVLADSQRTFEFADGYYSPSRHLLPRPGDCLEMLSRHLDNPQAMDFFDRLYAGEYDSPLNGTTDVWGRSAINTNLLFHVCDRDTFDRYLQLKFKSGALTYEYFERSFHFCLMLRSGPLTDNGDDYDYEKDHGDLDPDFVQVYREYSAWLIKALFEQAADGKLTWTVLEYLTLSGINWITLGLEYIDRLSITAKDLKDRYSHTVQKLLLIDGLRRGESDEDLIAALKRFREPTLLLALPYAGYARNAILRALGWDTLLPLQTRLFQNAGSHPRTTRCVFDLQNSPDPDDGVIDRIAASDAVQGVNPKLISKYAKAFQISDVQLNGQIMLLKAVADIDRDKIEKNLVRHTQSAIKAYGLYPVVDDAELRARYLKFKTIYKEATEYGTERQANTQAAVKAGLKNLAQSAGYSDEIRLEWAMEAEISDDTIPFGQSFEADEWSIQLVMEGITPRIQVSKQDKLLKSVPPKVRQTDSYKRMREAQDTIRSQASRFRKTLEDMMCNAETLTVDELASLIRIPTVRVMLDQLVLVTEDGRFGRLAGRTDQLAGPKGETVVVAGPLRIAHIYDLFQGGVLPDWQRAIVREHCVQPFKQAFRELYVVTPAEREAGTVSRRFVGHAVDSSIASRLLQSRNWNLLAGEDVPDVYKRFPRQQIEATIGFPDAIHYLSEQSTVTVDEIRFYAGDEPAPLEDVDPIVFSEVMRDVDLVASVAHVEDDDARWSSEAAQRRAELIVALADQIGLKQVSSRDHFAYVTGKLANYRIHLGTGHTFIEPGSYLCIVPARKAATDELYLPFAETDLRTAEIVSKIFLLIDDDKITDRSIVAQLRQAGEPLPEMLARHWQEQAETNAD